MTIREQIKAARGAGVPLIQIITADQPAMVRYVAHGWNGEAPPVLVWDCARNLSALSDAGQDAIAELQLSERADLVEVLNVAPSWPARTLLIVQMSNRTIDNPATIQSILNARDELKGKTGTLVLLAPGPSLPPELASDVLSIDDPFPNDIEVGEAIARNIADAREAFEVEEPDTAVRAASVAALIGLPSFPIEQSLALSLKTHKRLNVPDLLARKRTIVSQIKGLKMNKTELTFEALGGLREAIAFGHELFTGKDAPLLVVIIEEMEKAIAGFGTESTGTTGDQVGVLLTNMEDEGWSGLLAAGVPGSGKSQFSKSLGATYGATVLTLDIGAARGSLLGQTEQQIRAAVKTISALGRNRVFFVASINRMATIPTELRRRFRAGIWFFDLPSADERAAIWPIHLRAFGLADDAPLPDDTDWTGAEIRNCCEFAYKFDKAPRDVAKYISPVAQQDPEAIDRLRQAAHGRWLSASVPGTYRLPSKRAGNKARAFTE